MKKQQKKILFSEICQKAKTKHQENESTMKD